MVDAQPTKRYTARNNRALLPDRVRRWAPRTRTGCLTCRKRRVKCDESKPVCSRCMVLSRDCNWPISLTVPLLPAGQLVSVQDLLHLVPHTTPDFIVEGYATPDGVLYMTLFYRMKAYLFELPARVGHNEALDSAVACVAAALRLRHGLQIGDASFTQYTIRLYGQALRMLQRALQDTRTSCSPEILCATELLCVFEALAGKKVQACVQHAKGAAKLIQHRGINNFTTEFEKSLLAAHLPILIVETFLVGEHLFLEQEQWVSVLRSCISSKPAAPDRSAVAISLYLLLTVVPGLFADTKSFIQGGAYSDAQHDALLCRAHNVRTKLRQWYTRWKPHLFSPVVEGVPVRRILPGEEGQNGKRLDLLCIYEIFLVDCNRLCVALGTKDKDALEEESLAIAKGMIGGQNMAKHEAVQAVAHDVYANAIQAPIIVACLGDAAAAMDTAVEWGVAMRLRNPVAGSGKRTVIPTVVFFNWLDKIAFGIRASG